MYLVFAIVLAAILIILFSVFGPHYKYNLGNRIRQKLPILLVLIAIFIVAVVLVLILVDRPKSNSDIYNLNTSLGDLRFETIEDSNYALNAAQFFFDPDENVLRYEVSEIRDVTATVNDDTITFTPDLGWSGTRQFTITAIDDRGGEIESPKMTLVVHDVPRKTFLELYNIYCWYVNLFLFLVLLFLVFVAFIVKQKVRRRK